ncbi:hypothetical protein HG530_014299 [Fusarium avenaceum]|nr:hypothetical protein HG530_014299 [Fusarium avenaceum]
MGIIAQTKEPLLRKLRYRIIMELIQPKTLQIPKTIPKRAIDRHIRQVCRERRSIHRRRNAHISGVARRRGLNHIRHHRIAQSVEEIGTVPREIPSF